MPVRYAASGIAVVSALLVATDAFAHHSFAPHFDCEQAGQHLRHRHRVRGAESAQLPPHRRGRRERQDAGIRLRIARRHAAHAQRDHAADCSRSGTKVRVTGSLSRHSPYMCFFDSVELAGRPRAERQRSDAARPTARGATRGAQGHLRHLAARADAEPQHQRPAADDAAADAGRREGRRRLRSVQGRSDVPLRSGRDPPRVGRTGHAARDRARRAATSCCVTSGWTCAASST